MLPVAANDAGRLVVGEGVSIKGEIHSCESLVVWGRVDSEIQASSLEIFEPGIVIGDAKVGEAEVRGSFEGALEVAGTLIVRADGSVAGSIRYGELHVEPGGLISGEVQSLAPERKSAPAAKPLAEPGREAAGAA